MCITMNLPQPLPSYSLLNVPCWSSRTYIGDVSSAVSDLLTADAGAKLSQHTFPNTEGNGRNQGKYLRETFLEISIWLICTFG